MTESHKPLSQCTLVEFKQLHPCSLHNLEVGYEQFADGTVVGEDGLPPRLSHATGRRLQRDAADTAECIRLLRICWRLATELVPPTALKKHLYTSTEHTALQVNMAQVINKGKPVSQPNEH